MFIEFNEKNRLALLFGRLMSTIIDPYTIFLVLSLEVNKLFC